MGIWRQKYNEGHNLSKQFDRYVRDRDLLCSGHSSTLISYEQFDAVMRRQKDKEDREKSYR